MNKPMKYSDLYIEIPADILEITSLEITEELNEHGLAKLNLITDDINKYKFIYNLTPEKDIKVVSVSDEITEVIFIGIPAKVEVKSIDDIYYIDLELKSKSFLLDCNELLEIELDAVSVETVGDVMTLFYLLKEKLGMDFTYAKTPQGSIDPTSIQIHFKNNKINSCLERVITEEIMAEQLKQGLNDADNETANTQLLTDKFLLDLTKEELCKSKDVL